ncbi:MAG: SprT family zinc-dependent metalloprotease [bacterium]
MNTNTQLQLGSVDAYIVRKQIKHVHVSVLPPHGKVRITAPSDMHVDTIRTLLAVRLPWIKKQQAKFSNQERQSKREFVSGETHYYFGKQYRLEVIFVNTVPKVSLKGKTKIQLQVRPDASPEKKQQILMHWYREQLTPTVTTLLTKWQKKIGVQPSHVGIRKMKTKWGTCNHHKGRILLNLDLATKPNECIEYVIVHELLHLIERKHNEQFIALMNKYLPKWHAIKQTLNTYTLSHQEWDC